MNLIDREVVKAQKNLIADKWKESNNVPFRVWRRMQKKKKKKPSKEKEHKNFIILNREFKRLKQVLERKARLLRQ